MEMAGSGLYKRFAILTIVVMWASFAIFAAGCGGGGEKKTAQETAPPVREFTKIKIGSSANSNDVRVLVPGKFSDGSMGIFVGTMEGVYFYSFNSKTVKQLVDGEGRLKGAKVTAICQEEGGKMWIGTEMDGIYSYNFNMVKRFDEYKIQAIAQSSNGDIWVGSQNGLMVYDGKGFTKFTKKNDPSIPNDDIGCFGRDDKNNKIYAGSKQGVIVIDGPKSFSAKTGTSQRPTPSGDLIEEPGNTDMTGNTVSSIAINSKGVMYIATNMGVNRCKNFSNWSIFSSDSEVPTRTAAGIGYKKVKGNSELLSNWVRSIYLDAEDSLWIATTRGLSFFNGDNKWENHTTSTGLSSNTVNAVTGSGTAIYIGTSGGLDVFDFPPKKEQPDKAK